MLTSIPNPSAKRYERLLKAHDINPSTPRKGKAAQSGSADDDVKTPASKKRKRGGASTKKEESDEDDTPIKKDRTAGKKGGFKAEDDDDVKVKGETDGSCNTPAITTGVFPQRQGRPNRGNNDCVVIAERSVWVKAVVHAGVPGTVPVAYESWPRNAMDTDTRFWIPQRRFLSRCHGANFGFPSQTTTSRSNSPSGPVVAM